jgi:hypothetical protein
MLSWNSQAGLWGPGRHLGANKLGVNGVVGLMLMASFCPPGAFISLALSSSCWPMSWRHFRFAICASFSCACSLVAANMSKATKRARILMVSWWCCWYRLYSSAFSWAACASCCVCPGSNLCTLENYVLMPARHKEMCTAVNLENLSTVRGRKYS